MHIVRAVKSEMNQKKKIVAGKAEKLLLNASFSLARDAHNEHHTSINLPMNPKRRERDDGHKKTKSLMQIEN